MPITMLTPSVEQRLRAYHELSGRAKSFAAGSPMKPTITISREFGCEAFPLAEDLVEAAERRTGEQWLLADLSLLNAVAREHDIPEQAMLSLGHKPRWLDEAFGTLSPSWKTDSDYHQLLREQVIMIASAGNAVFVGLGAGIITQSMHNCFHFRLIADPEFRIRSIARRMRIDRQEAEHVIAEKEKERDKIIRRLLDADEHDPLYYHAIFNNGKVRVHEMTDIISEMVFRKSEG